MWRHSRVYRLFYFWHHKQCYHGEYNENCWIIKREYQICFTVSVLYSYTYCLYIPPKLRVHTQGSYGSASMIMRSLVSHKTRGQVVQKRLNTEPHLDIRHTHQQKWAINTYWAQTGTVSTTSKRLRYGWGGGGAGLKHVWIENWVTDCTDCTAPMSHTYTLIAWDPFSFWTNTRQPKLTTNPRTPIYIQYSTCFYRNT